VVRLVPRLLASALAVSAGCTGSDDLFVDVRTDLLAGPDFDRVRVELLDSRPGAGPEIGARIAESAAGPGDPFESGVRAAEYGGVEARTYALRVELREGPRAIAAALSLVRVTGDTTVLVTITRDCRDLLCPGPGDGEDAVSCLGGRCVTPECAGGDPATCPPAECAVASGCSPPALCARAECTTAGICFDVPDHERCAAGELCDPDRGCVSVAGTDAGIDAGTTPDAGADAGSPAIDSGPACECTPGASRDCGRCGRQDCGSDCQWEAGCRGESGVCMPGERGGTYDAVCPYPVCGTDQCWDECTEDCTWGRGGCENMCTGGSTCHLSGTPQCATGSTCADLNGPGGMRACSGGTCSTRTGCTTNYSRQCTCSGGTCGTACGPCMFDP
jgi:hypothetical protein